MRQQFKTYKVVYRRYAGLFFSIGARPRNGHAPMLPPRAPRVAAAPSGLRFAVPCSRRPLAAAALGCWLGSSWTPAGSPAAGAP